LNINDNGGFKALYGSHWWHFIGPALREIILPEDDYKIRVNGELVWDHLGSWEHSQDILNFSGSLEDKMMQSRFYVFLAVGKLLFGRHAASEAINFAVGMVGAKPETAKEPLSFKNLHLDFWASSFRWFVPSVSARATLPVMKGQPKKQRRKSLGTRVRRYPYFGPSKRFDLSQQRHIHTFYSSTYFLFCLVQTKSQPNPKQELRVTRDTVCLQPAQDKIGILVILDSSCAIFR